MRRKRSILALALIGLLAMGLGACGSDNDDESTATTAGAEPTGPNVLTIKERDYGFTVEGAAREGWLTLDVENVGKEWHMVGVGKLKAGKTIADVSKMVGEMAASGGEEEEEATTTTAAARGTSTSAGAGGEEEEEDPFAEFFEEEEYGVPGGIHQPGSGLKVTTNKLDAGKYGILCFLPTEGEGTPHFMKGMIAGFEVKDVKTPAPEPTTSTAFTLNKGKAPTGPATLPAGETTFKITADTGEHEFAAFQSKAGKSYTDIDKYFSTLFGDSEDSPPPVKGAAAQAPTSFLADVFDFEAGDTIYVTLDLKPGTYQIGCPFTENDDDDDEANNVDHGLKELLKVTVT